MTCAAAAEFLPDKLSGIVYGMCLDTQGATPNPEKVYVAGPGARPGLVPKRGLAPNRIAIRPQEMDAGEVPVPISKPCRNIQHFCFRRSTQAGLRPPRSSILRSTISSHPKSPCLAADRPPPMRTFAPTLISTRETAFRDTIRDSRAKSFLAAGGLGALGKAPSIHLVDSWQRPPIIPENRNYSEILLYFNSGHFWPAEGVISGVISCDSLSLTGSEGTRLCKSVCQRSATRRLARQSSNRTSRSEGSSIT